jgi:phage terminase large subunit GpA-like protein
MTGEEVKEWVKACIRGHYQPTPREAIWEWAERTLKIPRGGENDEMAGQPWSSDYSPYTREVMDWFRTPGKAELFVVKSSQVGFTMAMLIVICWHIVHRPVNIGYCIDSREEAHKISKVRLKRWIKDNRLLDAVKEDEDDLANMTYFLRSMTVYLMGAYSEGAFRNKALTIGILDELDAHPPVDQQGTTADAMRSRLKRNKNAKLVGFSTPKLERDQTWQEYLTGTREKFFVPCPHCQHMQPLEWKRVRFSGKEFEDLAGERDLAVVEARTFYECEMGCRIEHQSKFEMMKAGEWRATHQGMPGKRSMHISDLYSNFVTWGRMALEWHEAQANIEKLRAFMQQRLGEPFRQEAGTLKERDVLALRQKYKRGTCPIVPVLVALLTDVQQSTMKWVKVAFTGSGDLYVIDWGETGTWAGIAEQLAEPVKGVDREYPVECGFVDEGDGNRSKEVRTFTEEFDILFPVKGRGERQIKDLVWPSFSLLGDVEVLTYHVNDHVFKSELLFSRIQRREKKEAYGGGRLILPRDVSPEFVAELLNERLEKQRNKYKLWEEKWVKTGNNDYLDCLKYALAMWTLMEPNLRAAGRIKPEAA